MLLLYPLSWDSFPFYVFFSLLSMKYPMIYLPQKKKYPMIWPKKKLSLNQQPQVPYQWERERDASEGPPFQVAHEQVYRTRGDWQAAWVLHKRRNPESKKKVYSIIVVVRVPSTRPSQLSLPPLSKGALWCSWYKTKQIEFKMLSNSYSGFQVQWHAPTS